MIPIELLQLWVGTERLMPDQYDQSDQSDQSDWSHLCVASHMYIYVIVEQLFLVEMDRA